MNNQLEEAEMRGFWHGIVASAVVWVVFTFCGWVTRLTDGCP